ncbi:MAG: heme ABC transporter ATP-binding protein [Gammaproteobacteria bacterium]|nr:heme ABC transporter ATP-binding protein [Gammaproteobacteria bacterium]
MLELNNVQLQYDSLSILNAINLQIAAGEVAVVLGPNGVGKSTLLKVASGEIVPSAGAVRFNGRDLGSYSPAQKARRMAVLPQHSSLSFAYAVEEVVMLGRTPHATGVAIDRDIVAQALAAVDASYLSQQIYTRLSGGEKQRVQLARVLAQVWQAPEGESGGEGRSDVKGEGRGAGRGAGSGESDAGQAGSAERLLILDEPTSALDYAHQQMLMTLLRQRAEAGCSVLLAMHDLNLAASCADKMVLMRCGEIYAVGSPDEVLREDLLREVFQVTFCRVEHPVTGRPWLLS